MEDCVDKFIPSYQKMSEDVPDKHLNPLKLLMELEEKLPDKAILVADGGDFVGTASYILRFVFEMSYHYSLLKNASLPKEEKLNAFESIITHTKLFQFTNWQILFSL